MADVSAELQDLKSKVEFHITRLQAELASLQYVLQSIDTIAAKSQEPD